MTGTNGIAVEMTAIVIPVPDDPSQTTAYITTYDGYGDREGGVSIQFECLQGPGTAGYAYDSGPFTGVSSTSVASLGELNVALPKSSTYRVSRGRKIITMQTGTNTTVAIPEVVGTP
jgi:hypothetical protein